MREWSATPKTCNGNFAERTTTSRSRPAQGLAKQYAGHGQDVELIRLSGTRHAFASDHDANWAPMTRRTPKDAWDKEYSSCARSSDSARRLSFRGGRA